VKLPVARLAAAAILLVAGSTAALAQPAPKVYRIGFVSPASAGPTLDAFRQALRELGYVEGRNVVIEARFAEGRSERIPELVAEVLRSNVDVLLVGSTVGALAAKKATATVPIVFAGLIDPVVTGIVPSLARPGGNITGATFGIGAAGVAAKWVELVKDAFPDVSHVAALWNPANPAGAPWVREMRAAARSFSMRLDLHEAGNPAQLAAAFAAIGASGARAMIVTNDPFFFANRLQLIEFAAKKRVPAVYFTRDFADAGGLMSYGSSVPDSYRRAAMHVDRILKGAKAGDLPIDQPMRFDLVVNLKTARALGVVIPRALLTRADEIID
jgi:putative ABC transport system substrate-binding protein